MGASVGLPLVFADKRSCIRVAAGRYDATPVDALQ
jgi:hypothetical protein